MLSWWSEISSKGQSDKGWFSKQHMGCRRASICGEGALPPGPQSLE